MNQDTKNTAVAYMDAVSKLPVVAKPVPFVA